MPVSYQVINIRTKQVVRQFTAAQPARNLRDRLDLQHGSIIHVVRPIYA